MTRLRVVNGYVETNLSVLTMLIKHVMKSSFRVFKRHGNAHDYWSCSYFVSWTWLARYEIFLQNKYLEVGNKTR